MNQQTSDAFTVIGDHVKAGPAVEALRQLWVEIGRLEGQELAAHRAGFNEACDRMGLPSADTPMDRIAKAGGECRK